MERLREVAHRFCDFSMHLISQNPNVGIQQQPT